MQSPDLTALCPAAPASPRVRLHLRSAAAISLAVTLLLGIASPAFAQTSATAPDSPPASHPADASSGHPYAVHVAEAAQRFGIPEAWIWSVMRVESAGDPVATSRAGAMGLMQVMPGTYAELRSRYGFGPSAYDVRDNILAGAAYLREMHDRYGAVGMLAAYNAGPGRWEDYVTRGRPLPAETVAYITRLGATVSGSAAPSPAVHAQVDRFAWRRASLFVALDDGAAVDGSRATRAQVDRAATAPRDEVAASSPDERATARTDTSHALFAVRRPE
mgnify:CR=1 FL=1